MVRYQSMRAIEIGNGTETRLDQAESTFRREVLALTRQWLQWLAGVATTEELWLGLPQWCRRAPMSLSTVLEVMGYHRWWLRRDMLVVIDVQVLGLVSALKANEALTDTAPETDRLQAALARLMTVIAEEGESDGRS